MKITFGILTNESDPFKNLLKTIKSIKNQKINIMDYEIIIVTSRKFNKNVINIDNIPIIILRNNNNNENKRTLIINKSNKDYILFLKDYHILDNLWYYNIKNFNNESAILFKILYDTDKRYFDLSMTHKNKLNYNINNGSLISYNFIKHPDILKLLDIYVSGCIFLFNKHKIDKILFKNKFKDTCFCNKLFNSINYKISFSSNSIININLKRLKVFRNKKYKLRCRLINDELNEKLNNMLNEDS